MMRIVQWVDLKGWVTEKRKKKGWSQETLAKTVGVNKNTLSGYLNGYNSMPLDVMERLCEVLGANLVIMENE